MPPLVAVVSAKSWPRVNVASLPIGVGIYSRKVETVCRFDSKLTLGKDVADLGGTLLAYIAWKHATEGKELKTIDGFTPDRRFFIGMGQWACGSERDENKRLNAITNPHSPDEYRINGVVSNMPEFAHAFACKGGATDGAGERL